MRFMASESQNTNMAHYKEIYECFFNLRIKKPDHMFELIDGSSICWAKVFNSV